MHAVNWFFNGSRSQHHSYVNRAFAVVLMCFFGAQAVRADEVRLDQCELRNIAQLSTDEIEKKIDGIQGYANTLKRLIAGQTKNVTEIDQVVRDIERREVDCIRIESSFRQKVKGLPYNSAYSPDMLDSCRRDSIHLPVKLSQVISNLDAVQAAKTRTDDAIDMLQVLVTQCRVTLGVKKYGR